MGSPRVEMLARFGPYEGGWRDGEFHNPEGLASDSEGNIYVADETNHRVQKLAPDGRMLWKVGSIGPDGRPRAGTGPGEFNNYRSVSVDHDDNLYVGDSRNCRVQSFDSAGRFRFMFGSQGNGPGQFGGGAGPNGVAVDEDGFIYVTDTHTSLGGNNRVQKFDQQGHFILSFGEHGTGPGQFAGKVGPPVPTDSRVGGGTPEGPYGIAIGALSGHLYIADTDNSRIQVFDREGVFVRSFGEGTLIQPRQICLDSRENLYTAGFHTPPQLDGIGDAKQPWPEVRFLWVLDREGRLLLRIGAKEADDLAKAIGEPGGLFDHGGGRHHSVTLSRADETLLYFQSGHVILKCRIHW